MIAKSPYRDAPHVERTRPTFMHRLAHVFGLNACEPVFEPFREPIAGLSYDVLHGYRCVGCGMVTPWRGKLTPRPLPECDCARCRQ